MTRKLYWKLKINLGQPRILNQPEKVSVNSAFFYLSLIFCDLLRVTLMVTFALKFWNFCLHPKLDWFYCFLLKLWPVLQDTSLQTSGKLNKSHHCETFTAFNLYKGHPSDVWILPVYWLWCSKILQQVGDLCHISYWKSVNIRAIPKYAEKSQT